MFKVTEFWDCVKQLGRHQVLSIHTFQTTQGPKLMRSQCLTTETRTGRKSRRRRRDDAEKAICMLSAFDARSLPLATVIFTREVRVCFSRLLCLQVRLMAVGSKDLGLYSTHLSQSWNCRHGWFSTTSQHLRPTGSSLSYKSNVIVHKLGPNTSHEQLQLARLRKQYFV